MTSEPITAAELYRLFAFLGAAIVASGGLTSGLVSFFVFRRTTRRDMQEEGRRQEQMDNLVRLSEQNREDWEEHRREVKGREDVVMRTRSNLERLSDAQMRMQKDLETALKASTAASEAIMTLAAGLAVQVRFGKHRTTEEVG